MVLSISYWVESGFKFSSHFQISLLCTILYKYLLDNRHTSKRSLIFVFLPSFSFFSTSFLFSHFFLFFYFLVQLPNLLLFQISRGVFFFFLLFFFLFSSFLQTSCCHQLLSTPYLVDSRGANTRVQLIWANLWHSLPCRSQKLLFQI